MNHWTTVAGAALIAGVLCTPGGTQARVEHSANQNPVQRFYGGLVAFERDTNSAVRRVLSTLTGQPAAALRAHPEPPPRLNKLKINLIQDGSHIQSTSSASS